MPDKMYPIPGSTHRRYLETSVAGFLRAVGAYLQDCVGEGAVLKPIKQLLNVRHAVASRGNLCGRQYIHD